MTPLIVHTSYGDDLCRERQLYDILFVTGGGLCKCYGQIMQCLIALQTKLSFGLFCVCGHMWAGTIQEQTILTIFSQ